MKKFIGPEEFLARATDPRSRRRPWDGARGKRTESSPPAYKELFTANLERHSDVCNLIGKMLHKGVAILFEDNVQQLNYAPTIRLVGSKPALLDALVLMANDYHPDEVRLFEQPTGLGTVLDLWWD